MKDKQQQKSTANKPQKSHSVAQNKNESNSLCVTNCFGYLSVQHTNPIKTKLTVCIYIDLTRGFMLFITSAILQMIAIIVLLKQINEYNECK